MSRARSFSLAVVVAVLGSLAAASPASSAPPVRPGGHVAKARPPVPRFAEGRVLVRFARGAAADAVAREHGLQAGQAVGRTGFRVVETRGKRAEAARDELRGDHRVEVATLDYVRSAAEVPDDAFYAAEQQPYLAAAGFERAWGTVKAGAGVVIAVVDTGVDLDHPDLATHLVTGWDFVGPSEDADPSDENGHGTMVAGMAAAITGNGQGVAGASWGASVMPVRVLDATGNGTDTDVAEGIGYAVDHGADVINLSLGGPDPSPPLEAAVQDAVANGVVVVVAAGNDGHDAPSYPAAYPAAIAVAATDHQGRFAYFSNYGPWVDLAAPGVDIAGTADGGGYASGDGTSFASPLVAGAAALVRAGNPTWTPAQVADRLERTAQDRGFAGVDHVYGFGFLDAGAAVGAAPSPAAAAPTRDATEPNGEAAGAPVLSTSQTVSASIAPEGDVDWFRISVPSARTVTVTVTPPPYDDANFPYQGMDAVLHVYAPDRTEVLYRDDTFIDEPEVATFAASAGTYWVRVSNYHGTVSPGSYTIATAVGGVPELDNSDDQMWLDNATNVADGAVNVPVGTSFTLGFPAGVDPASVDSSTVALVDGRTGLAVPATLTVTGTTTVTVDPAADLAYSQPYDLRVGGVDDAAPADWPMLFDEHLYFTTQAPPPPPPPPPVRSGYWMVDRIGTVYAFGDARHYGDIRGARTNVVDIEPTPSGNGYWLLTEAGEIFTFGDARHYGQPTGGLAPGEVITSMSANPKGPGYWVFTTRGRAMPFGGVPSYGDMTGTVLNGPVLDSVSTPSGHGYYMVASDGGIFTFGDAAFYGSMGGKPLNKPVQSLVPDGDNVGYWLVASDGGVFSFQAPFRGSMGSTPLNKPVTGMVRFGNGYLMVGEDGGIFNFSDKPFHGSLGSNPPPNPVVSVGGLDH